MLGGGWHALAQVKAEQYMSHLLMLFCSPPCSGPNILLHFPASALAQVKAEHNLEHERVAHFCSDAAEGKIVKGGKPVSRPL